MAGTGALRVFQHPLTLVPGIADAAMVERTIPAAVAGNASPLLLAAMSGPKDANLECFYNGKLDSPRLAKIALGEEACAAISGKIPPDLAGAMLGVWDFSEQMGSQIAIDHSPHALHGKVTNFPARAMTGWNWSGETMNYSDLPEQWGAIHFHDDDIYDAGWEADFELTIPPDMPSGLYAARLRGGGAEEYIPFVVGPAPGRERAIALLLPTASYMAYGNDRLAMDGGGAELLNNIVNIVGPHDIFLNEHPEFGGSLYDLHSDGSGICHASRLRPLCEHAAEAPRRSGRLWAFETLAVRGRHASDRLAGTER